MKKVNSFNSSKNKFKSGTTAVLALTLLVGGLSACEATEDKDSKPSVTESVSEDVNKETPSEEAPETAVEEPAPVVEEPAPEEPVAEAPAEEANTLTSGQENAIRSAKSYLEYSAFSPSGLINQLEFESYSTEDATFAVNSLDINWDEQAIKSAANYLEYSGFSRDGLIEQLEFEGFTTEQATVAVNAAGL